MPSNNLRVAFIAGTLGQGGAEKQLLLMAMALKQESAEVRVFCLTKGEYYESILQNIGIPVIWIGMHCNPLIRLPELIGKLLAYRPHIVQSSHFFTNLYTSISALIVGAVGIGCIRSDTKNEISKNGAWGKWLLKVPVAIISNSISAQSTAASLGIPKRKMFVLPNAIDVQKFDMDSQTPYNGQIRLRRKDKKFAVIGSLFYVKRYDRFLRAIKQARSIDPAVVGCVVGEGPERSKLEALAVDLGLLPDGVQFLGRVDNIPTILPEFVALILTSDHEGVPNVILEAMTARLPVITVPAGDAGEIVEDGVSGFVVDFDDVDSMTQKMITLVRSEALCEQMGAAGRLIIEDRFNDRCLGKRLIEIYTQIALDHHKTGLQRILKGDSL